MTAYFKATRPDGRDFATGTIDYGAALLSGEVIRHPSKRKVRGDPSTYLSVSVEPADCTWFRWPCRLFRVEPIGRVGRTTNLPNKRTTRALRVVEELPSHMAFGPNGEAVVALIDACRAMTWGGWGKVGYAAWAAAGAVVVRDAARAASWDASGAASRDAARAASWDAAWDAAWAASRDAAWAAARDAAGAVVVRDAAWDAAWAAARDAAWAAAGAVVVRDLLTPEQYDILTQPFVDAGFAGMVGR